MRALVNKIISLLKEEVYERKERLIEKLLKFLRVFLTFIGFELNTRYFSFYFLRKRACAVEG